MRRSIGLALVLCLLVASGCGDSDPSPPGGEAEYAGLVRNVSEDGRVLVHAPDDPDECGILFQPAPEVEVLRRTDDSFEAAAWEDLASGMSVAVWIDGAIAATCPNQGQADAIVIVEE
jgi:hypothetical protein